MIGIVVVVTGLLASHTLTVWLAWHKIRQVEAALHMKRLALSPIAAAGVAEFVVYARDTIEIDRPCTIMVDQPTMVRISQA